MLVNKLSLSPLKFLRRDLKKRQKKKAFKLNTRIGILKRFRLRVIFQHILIFAYHIIFYYILIMKKHRLHAKAKEDDNIGKKNAC